MSINIDSAGKKNIILTNYDKIIFLLIIILAILAPFYLSAFMLTVAIRILYMTVLVYSLSFLARGGMISLGQTIFFGLSGYTLARLLIIHNYSHASALALGILLALLGAVLLGLIVIRTKGVYFIMITLALGQMGWGIALQWSSLTRGDDGIIGVRPPAILGIDFRNRLYFYYLMLLLFIIIYLLLRRINSSRFGLALKAINDNPEKLKSLGYNVEFIRYIAFVISGFLAGIAGIIFVYYNGIINPATININRAVWMLVAAILGGINSLVGPLIGVASVLLMEVQIRRFTDRYMIIIGTVFVLVILFMPEGIWGFLESKINKLKKSLGLTRTH